MKHLKSLLHFIMVITLSFIINLSIISNSHSQNFNICDTFDDGAIKVKDESGGDVTSFALKSNPGVYNIGGSQISCDVTPDNYKVKIYKLGLCTEDPYREPVAASSNTIVADISSCVTIANFANGKEINIRPGVENNLLDGDLILPIGTYPYMYMLGDSHVTLKHIQKFRNHDGTTATISGYRASGNTTGDVCYTGVDDNGDRWVETLSFEIVSQSAGYTTLHDLPLAANFTGAQSRARYRCGTAVEATNGNDWTTTIINTFGDKINVNGLGTLDRTKFRNATQLASAHPDVPGIRQAFYLVKTDGVTAANSQETARRILITQVYSDPVVISENTTAFKLSFKTNNSINIRIYQEAAADTVLMATRMLANSLYMKIETKTRRARGAWR